MGRFIAVFFNFLVTFGAPVEAPLRRCAHFNSRLRKSASLEDTFFTKWCSRLSAVLIFTNDAFQNIGFGLVCVTPTAQNGVFMLFSMFGFMVIITCLLLASTSCLFLQDTSKTTPKIANPVSLRPPGCPRLQNAILT